MLVWAIILFLIIFDIRFVEKYLQPGKTWERGLYACIFFMMNYLPLWIFESYKTEISFYSEYLGFSFLENIDFLYFPRALWSSILYFLWHSSGICWYSFWISGIASIAIPYNSSMHAKAYWSCFLGVINSLTFLLYNGSSEDMEYLILFAITIGVFAITWIKLSYFYRFSWYLIHDIINKYKNFIIISVIFMLKRYLYFELDIFGIFYYIFYICFLIAISYVYAFAFGISYAITYESLYFAYNQIKIRREKWIEIKDVIWKICKLYSLIIFFTCTMFLFYDLATKMLQESWIIKETLLIVSAGALGCILIYPDDGDFNDLNQQTLNSLVVYFEFWVARMIFVTVFKGP